MHSYCAIYNVFRKYMIFYFIYNLLLYFCVIFSYNGIEAFNKNTQPAAFVRNTLFEAKVINKICYLAPQKGPCRGMIPMWYFDSANKSCYQFSWGGCQGNGNRFDTESECTDTCLSRMDMPKTRPKWCSLTFDYGFCFGAVDRYFYDPLWKVCKKTIYSGCGGNKNNFYSMEQCESVCRFGNGWLTAVDAKNSHSGGLKKVLIVDPVPTQGRPCNTTTR